MFPGAPTSGSSIGYKTDVQNVCFKEKSEDVIIITTPLKKVKVKSQKKSQKKKVKNLQFTNVKKS